MGFGRALRRFLADVAYMAGPVVCPVCHASLVDGEKSLCLDCLTRLPRTYLHSSPFNDIHHRLAAPGTRIEHAGAWFFYRRDNEFAAIIHDAKYRNMPGIAADCGELYAREIAADGFFDDIDLISPVPMHAAKEQRRGYNQAREAARGISRATGLPVVDCLSAARGHETQTRKSAWGRWLNTADTYIVSRPEELDCRHVLLVDDVITTGATMLRCVQAITAAMPTCRISVAALSVTVRT